MLWEHKLQVSVFTIFLSSPKLSQVFLKLDSNMESMLFYISFRKRCDKKENNLLTLVIKM